MLFAHRPYLFSRRSARGLPNQAFHVRLLANGRKYRTQWGNHP